MAVNDNIIAEMAGLTVDGDEKEPHHGVTVSEEMAGVYVFRFHHEIDLEDALEMSPCTFGNHLLLFDRFGNHGSPSDVPLHHVQLWVQIYGLPSGFHSDAVLKRLNDSLGEFIKADANNFARGWNSYMRIRIKKDVRTAIVTGTWIRQEKGAWSSITFQYENLPNFCYVCGFLGHTKRFCPEQLNRKDKPVVCRYGPELHATKRRVQNNIEAQWL
ncbi:uncharacterized protein LOC110621482 [Manihot esculenta]|uniref:uncharacterized protein LOC110621482 n=1 Tax=Manihot esculenta TaxID=3983 RepID=UPI000B5D22D8|nr:uncharacterized protein LOC110621482 [Manihot esculenta]